MSTDIEWVRNPDGSQGKTINPTNGCTKKSAACKNCYAEGMAARLKSMALAKIAKGEDPAGLAAYLDTTENGRWTGKIGWNESALLKPFKWRTPQTVFVGSMTDLFHEATPDEWLDRVVAMAALFPQHTFILLTKRAERMRQYFATPDIKQRIAAAAAWAVEDGDETLSIVSTGPWPLPNLRLGVTVENQEAANERIPMLLETPAAVRFISAEPLLDGLDPTRIVQGEHRINTLTGEHYEWLGAVFGRHTGPRLNWAIAGAETGPKKRPMDLAWARNLRDQCQAAGVPFFFKKDSAGNRELDGRVWEQFPDARKAVAE